MSFEAFNTLITTTLADLKKSADGVVGAGLEFRSATASGFEGAISTAAAATAQAHLEATLALAPRLPFATAVTVCDAFDAGARDAQAILPSLITAYVLGSESRATLAVGLLADERALAAAIEGTLAGAANSSVLGLVLNRGSLPDEMKRAVSEIGQRLANSLQAPDADMLQQGRLAMAAVADARAGVGVASAFVDVVIGAIQRVHRSAERGVNNVVSAARKQVLELREGRTARVFPGRAGLRVSLDRDYRGIVAGSYALLDKPDYSELFRVTGVAHAARAEFAISGKSSYLMLSGQNLGLFDSAVRETTIHARSERLERARAPLTTPVHGTSIPVAASVVGMAPGRQLIVKGLRTSDGAALVHHAVLVRATSAASAADGGTLVIDPALPAALRRESVVVYGNVVQASHGEAVAQILGAGDASRPFQRFELKQAPLTHRAAVTESGAASELMVRVSDVAWNERVTLFGAGPTEHAYMLRTDEHGRVWVQFGDGERGTRPGSGVNNVRATYRKGIGKAGNVRANTLTQPGSRPLGLKSVANPARAEGGTDPETTDAARRVLPLQARTLGRAVSMLDYEDFARAFAGVAQAKAAVLQLNSGSTVCLTVAGADGNSIAPSNPLWSALLYALRASGDPHVPLRLLTHAASTFRVGLKVKVDPNYDANRVLAQVDSTLRAHFSFDARDLGQPVQQSELIAVVHSVPGVIALDLDRLYGGSAPLSQSSPGKQVRLLATRMHVQSGQPRAAEILTLDPAPFDSLEVMK